MSYVESTLAPGETIKYIARKHWIVFVLPVLATVVSVVFPPLMIVPGLWLVWTILVQRTTELAVTSRKVIGKWGVLSRQTVEQRLEKIDSIEVEQSIWGRFLDFGTVLVHGSGTTMTPIPLIADPMAFRRQVEGAMEDMRVAVR